MPYVILRVLNGGFSRNENVISNSMKISSLDAKDCVTGPCHLLQTCFGSADCINTMVDSGTAYGDDPTLSFKKVRFKKNVLALNEMNEIVSKEQGKCQEEFRPDTFFYTLLRMKHGTLDNVILLLSTWLYERLKVKPYNDLAS